jgi:hypothetical protein
MTIAQKKYVGFALGTAAALLFIAPVLFGNPSDAMAVKDENPLTANELFGGDDKTGTAFAGASGLGTASLMTTITSIVRIALGFLGIIAVVIILLGGFKWMTSGGNDTKVGDAKKLIFAGIIGLVIVLSAYAIATFVINSIVNTVQSGTGGDVI